MEVHLTLEKMHENEIVTDEALVRRLIAIQHPRWSTLPIRRLTVHGTDNAMYRLGDDMVVRMPKIAWAVEGIAKEWQWLPRLEPYLPVAIPVPLALGEPVDEYPYSWSVTTWVPGRNPVVGGIPDPVRLARDIARFVRAMQRVDLPDGPATGRSLRERDMQVRSDIEALRDEIDADAVTAVWDEALALPDYDGPPVWVHADIAPGNLLLEDDRLSGVIDFTGVGVGDPSIDMQVAWNLLPPEARPVLKSALDVDEATWLRARARALAQALVQLPYYRETNIPLATNARHVIREVLTEAGIAG
jgi:aminoglycoside phosphotransferase (APT) family kinase protein